MIHRSPTARRPVAMVLLAALLLLAVGCGGGDPEAVASDAVRGVADVVRATAEGAAAVPSYEAVDDAVVAAIQDDQAVLLRMAEVVEEAQEAGVALPASREDLPALVDAALDDVEATARQREAIRPIAIFLLDRVADADGLLPFDERDVAVGLGGVLAEAIAEDPERRQQVLDADNALLLATDEQASPLREDEGALAFAATDHRTLEALGAALWTDLRRVITSGTS